MKLKNGDIIEHVDDCSAPKQMAGTKGQRKTIGKDIELYYAKRLLKGNRARLVNKNESTEKKGAVNAGTETKNSKGNQTGDSKNAGPVKP